MGLIGSNWVRDIEEDLEYRYKFNKECKGCSNLGYAVSQLKREVASLKGKINENKKEKLICDKPVEIVRMRRALTEIREYIDSIEVNFHLFKILDIIENNK